MTRTQEILIDPVTRVEGHGKISIQLDEQGDVSHARFHVTQYRGFEKFCQGRLYSEMPSITARICGICSISHSLASAKACDEIVGVRIPGTARKLRELLQLGEIIQSHSLHFFYLASPDLLFGMDADPKWRNILGVIEECPDLARMGISMRKFGQTIFQRLSGARIHIDYPVPGGVNGTLSRSDRDELLREAEIQVKAAEDALGVASKYCLEGGDAVADFARFDSKYLGTVDGDGNLEFYDGNLRLKSQGGEVLEEIPSRDYAAILAEAVEDWSYLKFPYYIRDGYPEGMYRVGPLGRLNVCDGIETPLASRALGELRDAAGETGIVNSTMFYHWARMIETLYAVEHARDLLGDDSICDDDILTRGVPRSAVGIGVVEAPRGTLIHHYRVDRDGLIEKVNLIVATGHNNLAMNRSVEEVARKQLRGTEVTEGMMNRLEAAIRCYDPCLSCSTHAIGGMPLIVDVLSHDGELLNSVRR